MAGKVKWGIALLIVVLAVAALGAAFYRSTPARTPVSSAAPVGAISSNTNVVLVCVANKFTIWPIVSRRVNDHSPVPGHTKRVPDIATKCRHCAEVKITPVARRVAACTRIFLAVAWATKALPWASTVAPHMDICERRWTMVQR